MPRRRRVLPKGRVLARCTECGAEAVSAGDGRPVTMTHKPECKSK